ncbi:prephenate dehydrogenase [Candidatus Soleaferrea massiliensis]|uniref:prephenate dehydrogenase n=1 Tax=Candidatus Soleaferrea massiliensis TaxID=1470354 RepID=UPI00058B35BE|nr:prephenate dehydrogenase [Candidatus Soleaferrea massiliensis]
MEHDFQVAVIGLGLIGGSFAKAIKEYTDYTVIGCDTDQKVLQKALNEGTIDRALTEKKEIGRADMTILCLYPHQAVRFIEEHLEAFKPGSLITDTCGIKRYVVEQAQRLIGRRDLHFIGAHPMAGREFSGYDYSIPTLFAGASMILTPGEDTGKIEFMKAFSKALGFAHVEVTTPQQHDTVIAFTSQIAHVLSNAYVKSPNALRQAGFSAGSFKDLSRVAKLNETMWTELFLLNRDCLGYELDMLIEHLSEYRDALKDNQPERLKALLKDGRELKERIG